MTATRTTFERLRSIHPIQDLWFKPRTVFRIEQEAYEHREPDHDEYGVERYVGQQPLSDLDAEARVFLERHVGEQTAKSRLEHEDCMLFLARSKEDDEPAGFYWGVMARSEPVWHDSYRLPLAEALVFNAYVAEEHRRRGLYRLLQGASHDYLFSKTGCEAVVTVVENRNTASMRANRQFGLRVVADNYLLKILSVNILSIIKNDITRVLFVLHRGGL